MKHKLNFLTVVTFLFAILFFASCTNFEDKAEAKAEVFFETFNNEDFDELANMLDNELASLFKEYNIASMLNDYYGEIESFEKYNSEILNSEDEIAFYYKAKCKKQDDDIFITEVSEL